MFAYTNTSFGRLPSNTFMKPSAKVGILKMRWNIRKEEKTTSRFPELLSTKTGFHLSAQFYGFL